MNNILIIGNTCRDNELRYTATSTAVLQNTIAVKRDVKNASGEYETDFIPITIFGKTAEFFNKYTTKGSKVSVTGKLRIDNYTTETGEMRSKTYIRVRDVELLGTKTDKALNTSADAYEEIGKVVEQEETMPLPF